MLPQILKRYDYAEIKKRMEAKGLALGEVLTREEAVKDQQVAHNCALNSPCVYMENPGEKSLP